MAEGHREAQKAPDPFLGRAFLSISPSAKAPRHPAYLVPLRESVLSMDLLGAAPGVKDMGLSGQGWGEGGTRGPGVREMPRGGHRIADSHRPERLLLA